MQDQFANKVILVTGGTGSIGSEIVRQLLQTAAAQIRVFSRDEHKQHELRAELPADERLRFLIGDVRDKERLDFAFQNTDVIFHAAALKHVPVCEYHPFEALKTNVIGTQNVIDVARQHDIEKVVAVSTDKAVSPESVLGASKLMMERLVTAANVAAGPSRTRFACVRFGNVIGSRGSVAHVWRKQIEAGGPITITHKKMVRYFMEIPEAVQLIFDATRLMKGGEIFVLKMKKRPVVEFAEDLIKLHGNGKKIKITYTGLRPGEKLDEVLYTNDEATHMLETNALYIITPQRLDPEYSYPAQNYPGARPARIKRS
jgi:FlaA1/EpsC-like NDP-sugar epimerase